MLTQLATPEGLPAFVNTASLVLAAHDGNRRLRLTFSDHRSQEFEGSIEKLAALRGLAVVTQVFPEAIGMKFAVNLPWVRSMSETTDGGSVITFEGGTREGYALVVKESPEDVIGLANLSCD